MFRIIDLTHFSEWDSTVRSFSEYDVYYLSGYVKAFHLHGDGDPFLFYYEDGSLRAVYVYMRRPTSLQGVYDSVTPYGYGGALLEGDCSSEKLKAFWSSYVEAMREESIADNFVRYHPVLRNSDPMRLVSNVIDLGKTVALDLSSPSVIWENISSKNRNVIRKAEKNGIEILHGKDPDLLKVFRDMYNATMDNVHADAYYYFGEDFYRSIHTDLHDNYELFYAVYEGQIIAMSIILSANKQMHYHLSASVKKFRNLAPTNLLLYKAALWGCAQGFRTFHLGGGVGSAEDSLYRFKEAFNKNSDYRFSIGEQIFDQGSYDRLVSLRRESDADFDGSSDFFPLYRC